MAVYADDFNRADAALTTPWVNLEGVHSVSGNKVVVGTISPSISYYNQTFTADQWAEADIVYVAGNGSTVSVAVRVNGSDLYYLWINGSAHVTISKRVSGSYSDAGTAAATVAQSFKARLEVQGTTLRAYADGVLVLTVTDAAISTGLTGIISATAGAANLDNYRCGDGAYVPAGGTTPVTPATRGTTWATKARVIPTRATTWNVAANLTAVTPASRATTWVTKARVIPTRATTWNVAVTGGGGGGNIGVRTFNGVADAVTLNIGNIGGASSLDCWIFAGRLLNDSADGEIISTTSYDPLDYFFAIGNGPHLQLYDGVTDSTDVAGKPTLRVSDGYVICAVRRVASAPCRWSKAVYATTWGAFVHGDQTGVVFGNRTYSAADALRICTAAPLNMDLALLARTTASSDADLATLTAGLDAWKALPNLTNLWRFDGTTVVDLKGSASQSGIVGTTTTAGVFPLADSTGPATTPVTASRATSWAATATVTGSRATTWNVAGVLTRITATRATTWNVAGPTSVYLSDDFTGTTVDLATWDVYNRLGDQDNQEVNAVIPANARVAGGSLLIDAKFEDVMAGDTTTGAPNPRLVHYTSAQIAQKGTFLYGRVDVRAKLPGGTGLWPCIWMLDYTQQPHQPNSADEAGSVTHYAEIDIAEFMGNQRSTMNCQIHVNKGGGQVDPGGFVSLPYDATTRFMVYRLDWTAGSAIFSVDAEDGIGFRVVQTITGAGNVPDVPMYLILHVAVGGNGGGTPNPATFPQTMEFDYARISAPVTAVTPASRATTWNVAAPLAHLTVTRSTSWATRLTVTEARATTWAVTATVTVSATRATTWNVAGATVTVTATRATTWNVAGVLTFVQATRATVWATAATVTTSAAATWTVRTPVPAATRSTTWTVGTAVAASRTTTWAISAGVQASRSTTWTVAGVTFFVTAQRVATWRVLTRASAQRSTTWKVAPSAPSHPYLTLYPDTIMFHGTRRVLALRQGDTLVWP